MQTIDTIESEALLNCFISGNEFKNELATFNAYQKQLIAGRNKAIQLLRYFEDMQIEVLSMSINQREPQLELVYSPRCEQLKELFNGFKTSGAQHQNEQFCVVMFGCFVYWTEGKKA